MFLNDFRECIESQCKGFDSIFGHSPNHRRKTPSKLYFSFLERVLAVEPWIEEWVLPRITEASIVCVATIRSILFNNIRATVKRCVEQDQDSNISRRKIGIFRLLIGHRFPGESEQVSNGLL